MKVFAPTVAPELGLRDIHGEDVFIGANQRKTLLSFFREANCPFCNFRVYELTNNYKDLSSLGLDIVAVFASNEKDVRKFIASRARPFRMVADPDNKAHELYGIEKSMWGKIKAMMTRFLVMMKGMRMVGLSGMATGNLLPADFLIDESGRVIETYYGQDAGDHIPMERIELFLARDFLLKKRTAT